MDSRGYYESPDVDSSGLGAAPDKCNGMVRPVDAQQAHAKDGSFNGAPNGKWDGSTVEATRKFQASHGLNPSGRLDAPTLQKLGLGSQTAGVAAPMPPLTTSSVGAKAAQAAQRQ